ncbi:ATP-binding protein [Daejeonella sp.]|uniref:ATP-binding protein n=1 Tax=Daejeonella sp. TaxID=2805397 RepID=UPI0027307BD5|nr:ATP-binding protein [Daejeonella sp.]MDP2414469.1 ATP-binding protein [Daejeonella sp.]
MKRILYIIGLLIPVITFGQSEKVFVIADSTLAEQWTTLGKDWRYQKGDHKEWADPAFDDSSWKELSQNNLNMPDGKHAIANRGEIAWFRKHIKADSNLNKVIVLNILQLGASEIYLDGKLIHQLGKLSSDLEKVVSYNPIGQLLEFPLEKGKEQILAVRYLSTQYKFPIYSPVNGYLRLALTNLSNTNSSDMIKNYYLIFNRDFIDNYYIALGIAILMFIIFSSFFIFFPNERINGYFATAAFFLILSDIGIIYNQDSTTGDPYWIQYCADYCVIIAFTIILYCLYRILEKPLDIIFKIIAFLGLITLVGYLLYEPDILSPVWVILSFFATIRIAVKSRHKNKIGSMLFMASSVLSLLFWVIYILGTLGLIKIQVISYIPFAFMVMPVTLAIYLGYSFGKRSQELRLNLEKVQKLSKEKESILSLQNETLETQVQERTASLNRSIEDLKSIQSQLIQSEKMASLGELTAGIAHEIQNPLNFVNNFSEVSIELIEEVKSEKLKAQSERDEELETEMLEDISQNLQKIAHHGKRADSIVKGMLQHSRTSTGEKQPTSLNTLADEFLKLSYHGLRAKDKSFNAELIANFDETLPLVNVVQQDIGRVLLNLFNNAFYAAQERRKLEGEGFKARIEVSTKSISPMLSPNSTPPPGGGGIIITVRDNGSGIPDAIKDKIMQPFFTTKPTGEGTGLGLSLSYDIIKAYGGELKVETKDGEGSIFSIILPVNN